MSPRSMIAVLCFVMTLPTPVFAQTPVAAAVDDAFTFFTIENNQEHVDGNPVDAGWGLQADFRVFVDASPRSAFRFVVKQGERSLGEVTCEGTRSQLNPEYANGPPAFSVFRCYDRAQRIRETGDLTVEVWFVDDDTDAATLLRSHRIRVLTATRVRGNGQPDAPHHYVDRNGEVLTSILMPQHSEARPYMGDLGRDRIQGFSGFNALTILINTHPTEAQRSIPSNSHLRCTVDGNRIQIPRDQVTGVELRTVRVTHTHTEGRRDRGEYEDVNFRQYLLTLPLTFRSASFTPTFRRFRAVEQRDADRAYLEDHPGLWECQWRLEREVLRTFRFRVGTDGRLVAHAEQGAGLSLGPNAYFVETVVPAAGGPFDSRVHRATVEQFAFLGRGFLTPEGRALSATLSDVGNASPPQPRAAAPASPRARGRSQTPARRR